MRIAQRMISRNYKSCLNTTLGRRAEAFEQGSSGIKFSKLSQNVAAGVRAMRIQEEREKSERQLGTVKNYIYEMNSVDSNLDSIDSILQAISEDKMLSGMNDTNGEAGRDAKALEIQKLKEQILQFANAQYGGKYLFGNTENGKAPFGVDEATGLLTFHDVIVEDMYIDETTGKYMYTPRDGYTDPNGRLQVQGNDITLNGTAVQVKNVAYDQNTKKFIDKTTGRELNDTTGFSVGVEGNVLYNNIPVENFNVEDGKLSADLEVPEMGDIYVDLGIGMQFGENAALDPRTGFKVSFSGLDVLGMVRVGKDTPKMETGKQAGNEVPRNVYDLLTQVEATLTSDDYDSEKMRDLHTQLVDMNDEMRASRTDLGTRMNFLERTENRLENDITNLSETETNLISADPVDVSIDLKQAEYSWMALLQLGSMLLPSSLLDFMR